MQLTHRNLMAAVRVADDVIKFPDGAKVISWLPAAHIAERNAHHYLPIVFAMTITCCPNPREIVAYLPAVKPTWFFAVPRIFEKLKAGPGGASRHAGRADRRLARRGAAQGRARAGRRAGARRTSPATAAEGEEKLFAGLRAMLGLDEAISVNAGAAPTPRDVLVFFHAIGIPLGELWGMSETCGVGAVNPPGRIRIGTVGPPVAGRRAAAGRRRRAADARRRRDARLPQPARARRPRRSTPTAGCTRATSREFDEDGYVRIVDRKKEIIINAAGKNMSPANIESALKGAGPLIGQIAVIGDARPYNTALVVLDADFAPAFAAQQGLEGRSLEELAGEEAVRAAVQAGGRPRQRRARARRAGQEVHDPARRLGARRRRADADDEAQAQADRREVRGRDRGDVRLIAAGPAF